MPLYNLFLLSVNRNYKYEEIALPWLCYIIQQNKDYSGQAWSNQVKTFKSSFSSWLQKRSDIQSTRNIRMHHCWLKDGEGHMRWDANGLYKLREITNGQLENRDLSSSQRELDLANINRLESRLPHPEHLDENTAWVMPSPALSTLSMQVSWPTQLWAKSKCDFKTVSLW